MIKHVYSVIFWALDGKEYGIRFWLVHVVPSNFGGIGLFTCKMTLYTYYMQPIEPNATKLYGI